jgi:hypothetical protein
MHQRSVFHWVWKEDWNIFTLPTHQRHFPHAFSFSETQNTTWRTYICVPQRQADDEMKTWSCYANALGPSGLRDPETRFVPSLGVNEITGDSGKWLRIMYLTISGCDGVLPLLSCRYATDCSHQWSKDEVALKNVGCRSSRNRNKGRRHIAGYTSVLERRTLCSGGGCPQAAHVSGQ